MAGSGLHVGGGLAQGLAQAFGESRARDDQAARDREARTMGLGRDVLGHLISSGRVADYADLLPYVDLALGTRGKKGKPKKGELDPHQILEFALGPALGGGAGMASAEGGSDAAIVAAMGGGGAGTPASSAGSPPGAPGAASAPAGGGPPAPASPSPAAIVRGMGQAPAATQGVPAAASAGAPAGAPQGQPGAPAAAQPRQSGLRLLTDAELIERETDAVVSKEAALNKKRVEMARGFYEQFKDIDPDFTLYDALAMAGLKTDFNRQYSTGTQQILRGLDAQIARKEAELGRPLTPEEALVERTNWMAATRATTDREAIARQKYGKATTLLTSAEMADVNATFEALGGSRAYRRTAATEQAQFDAPISPTESMATGGSIPVGATGPQLAGQGVIKPEQIEARKSTESLITQLEHIRGNLLGALPKQGELGELAPGAMYAIRRRSPQYRDQIAALESAVNNIVNVVARTVGQQRGTQTERDAMRAEAAVVALKDAVLTGDTQESAQVRIDETLRVINDVLGKMPAQAVPQSPAGAGAAANAAGGRAGGTGSFGVTHGGVYYTFPNQGALDAFKRAAGIP